MARFETSSIGLNIRENAPMEYKNMTIKYGFNNMI